VRGVGPVAWCAPVRLLTHRDLVLVLHPSHRDLVVVLHPSLLAPHALPPALAALGQTSPGAPSSLWSFTIDDQARPSASPAANSVIVIPPEAGIIAALVINILVSAAALGGVACLLRRRVGSGGRSFAEQHNLKPLELP
jgi:hypothetical protein